MTVEHEVSYAKISKTSLVSRSFFRSRALWLFLITIVPISPFFSGILGVPIAVSHVALCLFALLLFGVDVKSNIFKVAIIFIVYQLILSLVTGHPDIYFKQSIALFLCLLFASNLTLRDLNLFESLLRNFLIVGLFLSYISFIAMIVAPVDDPYSFKNPDGRFNYIFYFTFSNYHVESFIRPAFIFDEPGAFATIICLWVLLTYSLKRFNGHVFIIASLGLITQSLALLVFLVLMFIQLRSRMLMVMILIIVGMFYSFLPEEFKIFTFLFGRLDDENIVLDNNRTSQLPEVIENLDFYRFFFGVLALENREILDRIGDVSSNPLTPLFIFGFLQSIFFYLGIGLLIISALQRWKQLFAILAFLAILFQRPYYANVGYSMLIAIIFFQLINPRWFFKNSSSY